LAFLAVFAVKLFLPDPEPLVMQSTPRVSPSIQALIDKGLFDRIPVTFSTFFFDRIREWELLFPAEKNYYERLSALIDRSDNSAVEKLFVPLREVEIKMGVTDKIWPRRQFTLDQVDFLNRSPYYTEWRQAIAAIFSQLDPLLDAEVARIGHARLVVVVSPAELPVGPDRMWLRLRKMGKTIPLNLSALKDIQDYIALLLTGANRHEGRPTIAQLYAAARPKSPYDVWLVEAGNSLFALTEHSQRQSSTFRNSGPQPERGPAAAPGIIVQTEHPAQEIVALSYQRLQTYRTRLMGEVNRMVKTEEIRGPRQLGEKLKQLKMNSAEEGNARDPVVAEFVRATLLNGNGTLLINNTFVEWATVQAARRARPSLAVVSFGIRNKIKPFSSLLIYSDQENVTPIPTQMDTLGSYVDLEIFNHYLWLEFEKYAEYRRNTAYLFVVEGMDEMLVISPPDFVLETKQQPASLVEVFGWAREWLGL
jgi:hypothetical protein